MSDSQEDFKRHVYDAAFDTGEGRWVVHSFAGSIGADWDVDEVCTAIDTAVQVRWVRHLLRHDLEVTAVDGRRLHFDVVTPQRSLRFRRDEGSEDAHVQA